MKGIALLVATCLVVTACSDGSGLTAEQRAWCHLPDASESTALKFDVIFEAGVFLDLNMDQVNARAAGLREGYLSEGMTEDEAVAAVSEDLLEDEAYTAACQEAFESCSEYLIAPEEIEEICP